MELQRIWILHANVVFLSRAGILAQVRATLKIYDKLGREIATMLDDEKSPGKYMVKWDGGENSSGVYFYPLTAGDASTGSAQSFVQTRNLLLLK